MRGVWSSVVCVAMVMGAAGCHSVPLRSQPFDQRRQEPPPQGVFQVDWWLKLVGPQLWESNPLERASPAVDPDTGRIIALTRDGAVRSINPIGEVEWTFKTNDPFLAGAGIREGIVYVPGGDGILYALKARDGSLVWKYDAQEQLATTPLITEDRVFVASAGNTLFAVDRASGKWLWQYRRDLPAGFMIHGAARPSLAMGVLYAGFSDGFLVALDPATGAVKWERALSTPGKEFLDVDTTPIVDEAGRLFAASYKDGIYALNADTGDKLWNTTSGGVVGLLQRGDVLFTTGDQGISAVLVDDGRVLWGLSLDDRAAQPPMLARGHLVVPVNNALMFVDPATGLPRLSWDPGQGVTAPPTWADQRLYVLSNTGFLYALRFLGARGG